MRRHLHADSYRFAVQPRSILGDGLQRVAEGMPVVEDVTQPTVALVTLHDIHFHTDATRDNSREQPCITRQQSVDLLLEYAKQLSIQYHSVLDDLRPALAIHEIGRAHV